MESLAQGSSLSKTSHKVTKLQGSKSNIVNWQGGMFVITPSADVAHVLATLLQYVATCWMML